MTQRTGYCLAVKMLEFRTLWLGLFFALFSSLAFADRCPFCNYWNETKALLCHRCLRAISWTASPPRSRPALVVARTGTDVFIRGPNDQHPQHRAEGNAGLDAIGPIGSCYTTTGFRYLLRFDLPRAFAEANISMEEYVPSRVTLVLRVHPRGDALATVPVLIYPLSRPFREGYGLWGKHEKGELGASWVSADGHIPWDHAGGDYETSSYAVGNLPRLDAAEVEIDVTNIFLARFALFKKTRIWDDPGLIIIRDPFVPGRCQYRQIYGFNAQPGIGPAARKTRNLSPELYLE